MDDDEKYLFDLHGYLVIKSALSAEEVRAANAAIDHHADQIHIGPNELAHESRTLQGATGRGNLGGMLTWEKPHCDVFRQMTAHPNLTPYLDELTNIHSHEEFMSKKFQIDLNQDLRHNLEEYTVSHFLGAGILDPINLDPFCLSRLPIRLGGHRPTVPGGNAPRGSPKIL